MTNDVFSDLLILCFLQLGMKNGGFFFTIYDSSDSEWSFVGGENLDDGSWHTIDFSYNNGYEYVVYLRMNIIFDFEVLSLLTLFVIFQ